MMLPEPKQAWEQIGPAKQRAVGWNSAANGDVVAATRSRMGAIDLEGFGAETAQPCLLVHRSGDVHQLVP